ncbi:CCA tRNA nucleotidyltransferase [Loigolactobacillus coryniformis]|uniref:CCA tRNA nucleotidyltransferase n=1 Tax=Loigolactobacillus coryniformis TaxID=1610 RepID=UPI001C6052A2|nr:CCA tRNA nucleotidyltransferase [Loigolactobacillus coryniformis]MBW4802510.1 CCA tRNA nucleotidyltransferase [Loigolactobacillus coryniformis subsp. torquens]MBW4805207.1 CCA tRNA nucleotidyltransferase [Loigolactobacillus coryniformis subsp. torquens]
MKLTQLPDEFVQALPVLQTITQAGFEAYFVGGSVRDALLGKKIHDVDIATSAYPAEIKQIFRRTIDTGIQHGTVTVMQQETAYEVTTFRTESGYQDFRRPDHVTFVRSLREDLKRRDFTINALALQHDGTIIDLFAGLTDLENKVIRAVGDPNERFHEDALRMMRAVRFESQLGFTIEANTEVAIRAQHQLLSKIAVERIHDEFVKLMLGQVRYNGLVSFVQTELYQQCPDFTNAGPAFKALLKLPTTPLRSETAVWLLIAQQLQLDSEQVKPFLRHWKSANDLIHAVSTSLPVLQKFLTQQPLSNWDFYQAGLTNVLTANQIAYFYGVDVAETTLQSKYQQLPIKQRSELAVNGGDLLQALALKPGPKLGQLLAHLERAVVAAQIPNQKAALIAAATKL